MQKQYTVLIQFLSCLCNTFLRDCCVDIKSSKNDEDLEYLSIPQAADRDDFYSVLAGNGHISSGDDHQQILFPQRMLKPKSPLESMEKQEIANKRKG